MRWEMVSALPGTQHIGDEMALAGFPTLVADGAAELVLVCQQVNGLAASALHSWLI